jgi:DNA-binding response OmpR family regulator
MQHAKANGIRILIVEDEPTICEVCLRTLTPEGFEVDIAVNGEVAQTVLPKKEYHLCLIDIRTPLMNGMELYHHIEEKYPQLVKGVIFTTADILDSELESFLSQSERLYMPKPFAPDELRAMVRKAVKRLVPVT